jgi:hypothetical protein
VFRYITNSCRIGKKNLSKRNLALIGYPEYSSAVTSLLKVIRKWVEDALF